MFFEKILLLKSSRHHDIRKRKKFVKCTLSSVNIAPVIPPREYTDEEVVDFIRSQPDGRYLLGSLKPTLRMISPKSVKFSKYIQSIHGLKIEDGYVIYCQPPTERIKPLTIIEFPKKDQVPQLPQDKIKVDAPSPKEILHLGNHGLHKETAKWRDND